MTDGRTTDGKDGGGGGDGKLGSRPEGRGKERRTPEAAAARRTTQAGARGKARLSFSNFNCANRRRPLPYIAGRLSPPAPKPSYLKLKMNEVSQTAAEMNCQSAKPQSFPDATFGDSQIQTNCWLVNAKFFLNMHNLLRSALGLWPLFCSPAGLFIPPIPSSVLLSSVGRRDGGHDILAIVLFLWKGFRSSDCLPASLSLFLRLLLLLLLFLGRSDHHIRRWRGGGHHCRVLTPTVCLMDDDGTGSREAKITNSLSPLDRHLGRQRRLVVDERR